MRKTINAAILSTLALFPSASQTITANAGSTSCFVLRENDGKIALFSEDNSEPLVMYSTPLSELSPADMERLRKGIRLKTRAEVRQLIEDLSIG